MLSTKCSPTCDKLVGLKRLNREPALNKMPKFSFYLEGNIPHVQYHDQSI